MMRVVLAVFVLLITGLTPHAAAAAERPPMSAEQTAGMTRLAEPFFQSLQRNEIAQAYTGLFEGTLMVNKAQEVQQLVAQTTFIFQTYGAITRWELFASECATADLCLAKWMVHTNNGPVFVWLYGYQRTDRSWIPTFILVGDSANFAFSK